MNQLLRRALPPFVTDLARQASQLAWPQRREWEYIPSGWSYRRQHPEVRGWDVADVAKAEAKKWAAFAEIARSHGILGSIYYTREPNPYDLTAHNSIMIFGYSLVLASRGLSRVSMLDWGGSLGQYYLLGCALAPEVQIEYHCREVPALAQQGRLLLPDQTFTSDDSCLEHRHGFVLVSGSLQYVEDWQELLPRLAGAADSYILVTQLPTVERSSSFVMLQRAYRYGYGTEYLGWCFNRNEFLSEAKRSGLELVREFLGGEHFRAFGAPEECRYRGFLFRRAAG